MFLAACGSPETSDRRTDDSGEVAQLRKKLLELQGTTDQLNALIMSDFATCPNSGDTADALVRKMCQVAQFANNELRVDVEARLSTILQAVQSKLNASNDQLGDLQTSYEANVASVSASLATINGTLTTLSANMTSAQAAITALQTATASITGTLNGGMTVVRIGDENLGAGPQYESVLRRVDKTKLNAYVDAYSSWLSLASNPFTSVNADDTVTVAKPVTTVTISNATPAVVTWTTHGWLNGDPVMFSTTGALPTGLVANTLYYVRNKAANTFNVSATPTGALVNTSSAGSGTHSGSLGLVTGDLVAVSAAQGGNGFTRGHLEGEFVAAGAVTASFTIDLSRTATSGGTFGASNAIVRRVQGRGLAQVWATADGADAAVRQTTLGARRYNFRVKANGDLCYSTTDAAASFATINAEGAGIVCK